MRNTADIPHFLQSAVPAEGRVAAWNKALLTVAAISILCAASMLALHAAGPNAQTMTAGEGMLIVSSP